MNTLKAYKTISYILLPFAALLSIFALLFIAMGLVSFGLLFQGIITALISTYIILSFIFIIKGINQNKKCNVSMRKWIRTTGIITLIFAFNSLFYSFYYLLKPLALSNSINQIISTQKNLPVIDMEQVTFAMKGALYVMMFFATTLIIHYFETTKFLRLYSSVFEKKTN